MIYIPAGPILRRCLIRAAWTTGLGFAVALQLVGVLPEEERSLLEYPLEGNWKSEYWVRFIKGGFTPDTAGQIKILEGPGLGIDIDWNIIRRFGKRIYKGIQGEKKGAGRANCRSSIRCPRTAFLIIPF